MVTDKPTITVKVKENRNNENTTLLASEHFVYIKDEKRHSDIGIAGIFTKPASLQYPTLAEQVRNEAKYALPSRKLVLLLHGHQAHKNCTYQPILAAKLSEVGYHVLRIDFRGLGDSEDNRDPKSGRIISQDVEDITTVYEFVSSEACKQFLGYTLTLDSIIAHSRGVISMFEFARSFYVPNLINCCGRFESRGLLLKATSRNPTWDQDGGFSCNTLRFGTWQDIWIPQKETISAATLDTTKFSEINTNTSVLSVYAALDPVIPITAAAQYSHIFEGRHKLEIIPNCDHNFYGLPDDPNKMGLPIRKGKVNYGICLIDLLLEHLNEKNQLERFKQRHELIVSRKNPGHIKSRWPLPYSFSHISNFRDVGGYYTKEGLQVKSGIMFRCANPSEVTSDATAYMKTTLGINKIFDLRAVQEAIEGKIIDGFDVQNLGFNNNMTLSPEEMAKHYHGMFLSPHNFPLAYETVLSNSLPVIREFFAYIVAGNVDGTNAIVFHCTAGKDRTGLLAMLVLGIAGVDVDTICRDYELTTIGLTTEKRLIDKINHRGDKFYSMLGPNGHEIAAKYGITPTHMAANVLSSKYDAMRLFLDVFFNKYGSFDRFFSEQLNFSNKEIELIKSHIIE